MCLSASHRRLRFRPAAIGCLAWLLAAAAGGPLAAQDKGHFLTDGRLPPGVIGRTQLQRGGPLAGYPQPVRVQSREPKLRVSLVGPGGLNDVQALPIETGLFIGGVYRLRVSGIPLHEDQEVFPSIEVIDRLYPPPGEERKFAIPVDLDPEDLLLALSGKYVTRVIYVEDPRTATALEQDGTPHTIDVGTRVDPLREADRLGRPVAILRVGGRVPDTTRGQDLEFLWGGPPRTVFPPRPAPAARQPEAVPPPPVDPGRSARRLLQGPAS